MNFSNKIADFDIEERVDKAVDNFYTGYNCAQSVFLAYWDIILPKTWTTCEVE